MSHDQTRREEIVRRTFRGIEEDLDDLRDELGRYFVDYEGRLERHTERLPHWLDLPPADLRSLFTFEFDGSTARLGPRAVAIGAARIEEMIAALYEDLSPDALASQGEDALNLLERLERASREQALDADARLSEMLDAILLELEDRRESDEFALRELVTTGEVDRGDDAREEIAELWEDQRARAKELRVAWEPIEALVFEGIDAIVAGVEELRSLVHRAVEGFGVSTQAAVATDVDEPEESRVTEELATRSTATSEDAETDASDVDHAPDPEPEPDEDDQPDPDEDRWQTELDFGPTEKVDISSIAATDQGESDVHVDLESPELPGLEPAPPAEVPIETTLDPTLLDHEEARVGATSHVARAVGEADPMLLDHEEARGRAMRVVEEWRRVGTLERLIVALPLGVCLLAASLASLPRLFGSPAWVDIHHLAPWFFPWGLAGGVTLTLIAMFVRHWRTRWADGPELVQWREQPQEVEIVVERGGVRIGDVKYPQRQLSARSYRWESRLDGTFGWAVVLTPRMSEAITLISQERNYTRWDQSSLPIADVDPSSWQTPAVILEALRGRMGV